LASHNHVIRPSARAHTDLVVTVTTVLFPLVVRSPNEGR
jgi:hypothetical protein